MKLVALTVILAAFAAFGEPLLPSELLAKVFPAGSELKRSSLFLSEEQLTRARALAGEGVRIESALLTRFEALEKGRVAGTAYIDTHDIRTLKETVLVALDAKGAVTHIDVLAFHEPPEYRAQEKWLAQFQGKRLERSLSLKEDIRGITGATLTSRAVTDSVRRVLALHEVVSPRGEK